MLQILYAIAEFIILILQRPLKNLLNAGASEAFKQNLFPIADIVWIIVMLVLHAGLFVLLWSQTENTSFKAAEIMSIVIGGMISSGESGLFIDINQYGVCGFRVRRCWPITPC